MLLLIFQVVYNTGRLLTFALPLLLAGRGDAVPRGVAGSFLFITLVWPVLLIKSGTLTPSGAHPEIKQPFIVQCSNRHAWPDV